MKNKRFRFNLFIGLVSLTLVICIITMMVVVDDMQGNARVVNYAGIVRGATQRLIKNELYGMQNDKLIARLDDILTDLQTGEGSQNLDVLNDTVYQTRLHTLTGQWTLLKEKIRNVRQDTEGSEALYNASEIYFTLADDTVSAAEAYAEGLARKLRFLEILIVCGILLLMAAFTIQITDEMKKNRHLSSIAYIDPNTGLPNKRSCEEKLNEGGLLNHGQNVCCFMFDLNNLKRINDTLGHKTGDALILSFASALRRTAPPNMFIGRLGGDEFIGIREGENPEAAKAFIERLLQETSAVNESIGESSIRISFAYGYAFSSDHPDCTIKTLMDLADKNMYKNKHEMKANMPRI